MKSIVLEELIESSYKTHVKDRDTKEVKHVNSNMK